MGQILFKEISWCDGRPFPDQGETVVTFKKTGGWLWLLICSIVFPFLVTIFVAKMYFYI